MADGNSSGIHGNGNEGHVNFNDLICLANSDSPEGARLGERPNTINSARRGTTVITVQLGNCILSVADGRAVTTSAEGISIKGGRGRKLFSLNDDRCIATFSGEVDHGKNTIEKVKYYFAKGRTPYQVINIVRQKDKEWYQNTGKECPIELGINGFFNGKPYLLVADLTGPVEVRLGQEKLRFQCIGSGSFAARTLIENMVSNLEKLPEKNELLNMMNIALAMACCYDPHSGGHFQKAELIKGKKVRLHVKAPSHLCKHLIQGCNHFPEFFSKCLIHVMRGWRFEHMTEMQFNQCIRRMFEGVIQVLVVGVGMKTDVVARLVVFEDTASAQIAWEKSEGKKYGVICRGFKTKFAENRRHIQGQTFAELCIANKETFEKLLLHLEKNSM